MKRTWIILLLTCVWAESFARVFINMRNGELCLQSGQCKSRCCQRRNGLLLPRCIDKADENQECYGKQMFGVYYRCPCDIGLTCDADTATVGGIITNSLFGICKDPARRK